MFLQFDFSEFYQTPPLLSRPALWPTQPPVQWVWGRSFPESEAAGEWSWSLISI